LALSGSVLSYPHTEETDLKKGLSEKNKEEARVFLMNQDGTKEVEIKVTPFWRNNIPRDLDKIEIETILN
jgi:hypothetical protein